MSKRYQILRELGCDCICAMFIAWLNQVRKVEEGRIRFMHMEIEYERGRKMHEPEQQELEVNLNEK